MATGKLLELESVRGLAALAVVACHVQLAFTPSAFDAPAAFGAGAWHNGGLAVRVFFVLSGLVLTLKYFQTGDRRLLASGAVRRYPRLLLPVAAAVLLGYGLHAGGLMRHADAAPLRASGDRAHPWLEAHYAGRPSPYWAAKEAVYQAVFEFRYERSFNLVLWTMEVEYAGSLVAFGVAAALGGRRNRAGLYLAAGAVLVLMRRFYLLDFLAGLALAELLAAGWPRPGWWALGLLPAGLMVGDLPGHWEAGGWKEAGAPLVVAGAVLAPAWGRLLRVRPLVFLGRVSFGLYLAHVPVLYSLGCAVYAHAARGGYGGQAATWAAGLATLAASLALGYLATVTVDAWSIRLARWVDRRAFPPPDPAGEPAPPRAW